MGVRYHKPRGLGAALELLGAQAEKSLLLAGGTLATQRPRSREHPEHVIDILDLPELRGIRATGDRLWVGANEMCATIAGSDFIRANAPALAQAAANVGGPQIRNVATIGGNIAARSPFSDLAPCLLVLETAVSLTGIRTGTRRISLSEFLATGLHADEIVLGIDCERTPSGVAITRLAARLSLAPAIASVAVRLSASSGNWKSVGIAVGGMGPTAIRAESAERAFIETNGTFEQRKQRAADAVHAAIAPVSDVWASADYRRSIVAALTQRALAAARQQVVAA